MKRFSFLTLLTFLMLFIFTFWNNSFAVPIVETDTLYMTGVRNYYKQIWPKQLKMTGMRKDYKFKPDDKWEMPEITPIPFPDPDPDPGPQRPDWPVPVFDPRDPGRDKPTIDRPRSPSPEWPEIGRTPRDRDRDKPTIKLWPAPQATDRDRPRIGLKPRDQKPEMEAEEEQNPRYPIQSIRGLRIPSRQEDLR